MVSKKFHSTKRKGRRILVIVFCVLILGFVLQWGLQPFVKHQIEKRMNAIDQKYHFKIESLTLSVLTSTIELKAIEIQTDSLQKHNTDEKSFYVSGEIESLKISGISFLKILFKNDADADELNCSGINLIIETNKISEAESTTEEIVKPLLLSIPIHFNKITMGIQNINYIPKTASIKTNTVFLKNADLTAGEWKTKKNDTLLFGTIHDLNFNFEEAGIITKDSFYTFRISGIAYNDKDSTLKVDSVFLLPNYNEYDFGVKKGFETDRIHIASQDLELDKFQLKNYLDNKDIVASCISLNELHINIFRDKRIRNKNKKKLLIQDLLHKYPYLLTVDSLLVQDGSIEYKEHAEKANSPGKINFTKLKAALYNITNDTTVNKINDTLIVSAHALLMNKSKINVHLQFPLHSNNDKFLCNGNLDAMQAKYLNPMLEKNAFVYATSGTINSMRFNFTADINRSSGRMILLYDSLDIAIKNKGTDDTAAVKERLFSFLAKKFFIEKSNPSPHKPVREGIIAFERDSGRFIFNYCWKSILSGIKSSVGVKKNKQIGKRK
jgi:hypothetical protein